MEALIAAIIKSWGTIVPIIAGIIVILGACLKVHRQRNFAKFAILVLPSEGKIDIKSVGVEVSVLDELRLKRTKCLPGVVSEKGLSRRRVKKRNKPLSVKGVTATVPFLIQNIGHKESGVVKLVTRFSDQQVQISNIYFETFAVEAFYNQDEVAVLDQALRSKNASEVVRQYYRKLGLVGTYLTLQTSFSGGAFELVVLDLIVPNNVSDFATIFQIECPNVYSQRQMLVQWFSVVRASAEEKKAAGTINSANTALQPTADGGG